ncbi:MarR family winged helix-turn-helix transcriptional regulator [Nonomuraea typhae]|uniref:MarR family winged helix-turn-helix transcriptional regulator n=1 Tax=Nonomuraea typhae TaxID=2603600 RepID=UPI001FE69809|nr:MarR family transcriptional regulator [Nonomuraea typhae]
MDDERADLIRRITETQRDLGRFFAMDRSPLFDSNLTLRQLKVVMLVHFHGSVSGQDLAHSLGVGLGTVTGIVDRLVGHGLVSRHEDPNDRRVRRIELTDAGRELVEQINDTGQGHFRRIMECLDLATLKMMAEVTERVHEVAAALTRPGSFTS